MAQKFWTKVKNVVAGGPPPAYIQAHPRRVVDPFYVQMWRALRPPARVPRERQPLTRAQKFLLRGSMTVVVLAAGSWITYSYFAHPEERSARVVESGMKLLGPGNFEAAVGEFSDALSIWPGNAEAYLERGNAENALGKSADALADWGRAIDADPKLASAYTARGTYYRIRGDMQKALADLDRSVEIKPSVDAYYQRGQVHHALGEYAQAIQDFDRGIAELREAPYVYRARSAARKAIGDLEGAAADRDTADQLEKIH